MKLCRACDHHVLASETTCPFCGAALLATRAPLAPLGLALGLMTVACGPSAGNDSGESGQLDGSDDSGPSPTSSTTSPSSTASTTMGPEATSSSTTSVDDSSDDDQGGSFYAGPPDVGDPTDCDVVAQDCPPGEKCMPWSNDATLFHNARRCAPIALDPGQDGEPCEVEGNLASGVDDCDIGLACAEVDVATNTGVCRQLCDPQRQSGCDDPSLVCVGWLDGWFPICAPTCDPLLQDCGPSLGCYGEPDVVCDLAACGYALPEGAGQQGDVCGWANQCEPGLQCTDDTLVPGCLGPRCCTSVCDIQDPTSCDALPGTTCTFPYDEGMCPPQLYSSGVCAAP